VTTTFSSSSTETILTPERRFQRAGWNPVRTSVTPPCVKVAEETGVRLTSEPTLLGTHDHRDGLGRPARSHFFHFDAPPGLPDSWEHAVTGHGDDAELIFLCRFDPAPTLWPVQAAFRSPPPL